MVILLDSFTVLVLEASAPIALVPPPVTAPLFVAEADWSMLGELDCENILPETV